MAIDPASDIGASNGPEESIALHSELLRELGHALHSISYGTVEMVIHDGRVVQLERREKVRFEAEVSKAQEIARAAQAGMRAMDRPDSRKSPTSGSLEIVAWLRFGKELPG